MYNTRGPCESTKLQIWGNSAGTLGTARKKIKTNIVYDGGRAKKHLNELEKINRSLHIIGLILNEFEKYENPVSRRIGNSTPLIYLCQNLCQKTYY